MHSQLDHPNVIKLHGIVKGKPHSFLVLGMFIIQRMAGADID